MKSIRIKFFFHKCLFGMNLMGMGIFYQSQEEGWDSPVVIFISSVLILSYFIFGFLLYDHDKFEPEDEMTKQHEYRAQASTYLLVCSVLCVIGMCGLVSRSIRELVSSLDFSWEYAFYLAGILQFVEYALFIRIERKGDTIE